MLMKFLSSKARMYVVYCDNFKSLFEAQILNIHELNTHLNYLSSKVLSLYCVFDVQYLALCLTRELRVPRLIKLC